MPNKATSFVFVCLFGTAVWAQHDRLIELIFPKKHYDACGLGKLTDDERKNLSRIIAPHVFATSLEDSAVEYLRGEGWEEIEVLGTREMRLNEDDDDEDEEEFTIVERGSTTFILEPKTYSAIRPGRYLAQMGYSSCEIIDRSGDTIRFWTRDTR